MFRVSWRALMCAFGFLVIQNLPLQTEGAGYRRPHRHRPGNKCHLVPPNDFQFSIDRSKSSGIDEATYRRVLDAVEAVYETKVREAGGRLLVQRAWTNDEVGAFASRLDSGRLWVISMFGGMARHPLMTPDAYLLIACHEIGHHLGGEPRNLDSWASSEGQSDYYAASKCMRQVLEKFPNWETIRRAETQIDPLVASACRAERGQSREEFAICVRTAMAGRQLGFLLAELTNEDRLNQGMPPIAIPDFSTPDTSRSPRTIRRAAQYPGVQCRADTYLAGSLCPVTGSIEPRGQDHAYGFCIEPPFARTSVGPSPIVAVNARGARPACWYNQAEHRESGSIRSVSSIGRR